jgi:glycosyltransferase involved in cell wall biosynthesis
MPLLIRVMAQPGLREAMLIRAGRLTEQQRALATDLGVAERIVYAGGVSDEVLTALYSTADVLAQPSRAEGFGLPVIEAMACALPVVVSDGGALPEVAGDAGIVVPLGSEAAVERFAEALEALIVDTALRERVRQQGLARASLFRPERVVPQILSVYEDADR